jgi:hypothetical protein
MNHFDMNISLDYDYPLSFVTLYSTCHLHPYGSRLFEIQSTAPILHNYALMLTFLLMSFAHSVVQHNWKWQLLFISYHLLFLSMELDTMILVSWCCFCQEEPTMYIGNVFRLEVVIWSCSLTSNTVVSHTLPIHCNINRDLCFSLNCKI